MIKGIYKKANQFRKQHYLNHPLFKTSRKYAFVGFGMHSLSNLYPILRHFGIALKYISTKQSKVPEHVQSGFPGTSFVHSLDPIINDPEIDGVFVSADPEDHAGILTNLVRAGKKVFIEKPPCTSGRALEEIILSAGDSIVTVGLQRRYWPGFPYLRKVKEKSKSYIYRFYFGPFPQGDPIYDLFIHGIDFCHEIFGDFELQSVSHQHDNKGITVQLHVKHKNDIAGLIELSTHYSWKDPVDHLSILCVDEWLDVYYPTLIEGRLKPGRILNIPSERLLQKPVVSRKYFTTGNLVLPSFDLNTLVLQGFFDEIRSFVELVEKGKPSGYENDLIGLRPVYKILDTLKATIYPTASR